LGSVSQRLFPILHLSFHLAVLADLVIRVRVGQSDLARGAIDQHRMFRLVSVLRPARADARVFHIVHEMTTVPPQSSTHADQLASAGLPLRRYFLFVGGALLAVLFLAGLLPAPVKKGETHHNFPPIRIHSELRGPPAVFIDTSQRMMAPEALAQADIEPEAAPEARIGPSLPKSYAQLQSPVAAGEPRKKPEHNLQAKRKRLMARRRYPAVQIAQRNGWFDTNW